ncbi:BQ5605_C032g11075 [Microbotryum silenes-dioicae]|uniref:BQ5605_C032g11075 protein n=1 Tax=Microbotryum silenes-dioicae TaxID=796604 RepID=A0A2X0MHG0_9BASI|nr:BQ5605_C032g11075 [Microbotryum silenes-dioicae]
MASSVASTSKKRKSSTGQAIAVAYHRPERGQVAPILGMFPSTRPSPSTPFDLYTPDGQPPSLSSAHLVVAETDAIEFESTTRHQAQVRLLDASEEAASYSQSLLAEPDSAQYLIGIHDPLTNSLVLHSAPLHIFHPTIKSLKPLPHDPSHPSASSLFSAQRAALGATFGTKKAQRQLNAQERNKLSESSYGDSVRSKHLQSHLQQTIVHNSASLPDRAQIELSANVERATIPRLDLHAAKVDDVYPLDGIVSKNELASIGIESFVDALPPVEDKPVEEEEEHPTPETPNSANPRRRTTHSKRSDPLKTRLSFLPFRKSRFVNDRVRRLLSSHSEDVASSIQLGKKDKEKLRLLVYLSILLQFRQTTRFGGTASLARPKLTERLGPLFSSPIIIDGLLEKFTELHRGGLGGGAEQVKMKMTSTMETKLLSFVLVLCLRIDSYATDVGMIAHDLGTGAKRVGEVFRSLGCQLHTPSPAERERLLAAKIVKTSSEAKSRKQAVLRIPLEFPQDTRTVNKR